MTIFNTKTLIAGVYTELLNQHEEPFKAIAKSITDVSLSTIEGSLEDFRDILLSLASPSQPWPCPPLTLSVTQLDAEKHSLKEKTDPMLDVVHLHKKHLHHLDKKLKQTSTLLANLLESNIWFSSKVTDTIEKEFQSVIHHHENVLKSPQHPQLAPGALLHNVLDGIISHNAEVAARKNLVSFVQFASDLFQIEVSHLYTPATNEFTLNLHFPMVSNSNLLDRTSRSLWTLERPTSSPSAIQNCFKLFPALTCIHASTSGTLFCKGRKVMETSLKRSCLGALYLSSTPPSCWTNWTTCKFQIHTGLLRPQQP
jgi:hypothetical protein